MEKLKAYNEFVNDSKQLQSSGELLEMARIDNPRKDMDLIGEVWVYGQDMTSMSPHFHYKNNDEKYRFHLEILLKDLSICNAQPRKDVDKGQLKTWIGLSAARKSLKKWLKSNNSDNPALSNYQSILKRKCKKSQKSLASVDELQKFLEII